MKNYRGVFKIKVLLIFLLLFEASALAQDNQSFSINESPLPAPTGFINDYVGVIDAPTKQRLEERLTNFKKTTDPPIELAVAIVRTTGERPIFEYSLAVARGWKIGAKTDDNPSALLFVAIDDRKYFTQVSRDLEDELPDGLVGQLQRQYLVPAFKQNNYSKGVEDTLEAYIRAINERTSGTTVPAANGQTNQPQPRQTNRRSAFSTIGCCAIGVIILLILIFSRSGRSRGGGGGFGGGGGLGGALPWIIGSMIANSASRGSSDWGGGGSSWGGGDSGGWGGFGGGGDFGGGGAGGDW